MGLFGFGSSRPKRENALIIHAESGSVAGAYVSYEGGEAAVWHSLRMPVEAYNSESPSAACERALRALCERLAREGAPMLLRGTGSANISRATIYLGAPWEETRLRKETVELGREFTVSHATEARALAHETARPEGRRQTEDAIIMAFLNGYETQSPVGKRAKRADFIIRSSSLDEQAAASCERAVRSCLHIRPQLAAFAPAASWAITVLYPHDERYFILETADDATLVALVDAGILADVRSVPHGTRDLSSAANRAGIHPGASAGPALDLSHSKPLGGAMEAARAAWRSAVADAMRAAVSDRVTPQTAFLIAEDAARAAVKEALDDPAFEAILGGGQEAGAAKVVALLPQHVSSVRMRSDSIPDLPLMLLARAELAP